MAGKGILDIADEGARGRDDGEVESARREFSQGLVERLPRLEILQQNQIEVEHSRATAFHHSGVKFEQAADDSLSVHYVRAAPGMLVRFWFVRGLDLDAWKKALGQPLHLQQTCRAIVFSIDRGCEMGRLTFAVYRLADFK